MVGRGGGQMKTTLLCGLLLLAATPTISAQWATQRDQRVPSPRDGKFNLTAPTPKASDGKPDLSGVWLTDGGPVPPHIPTVEGSDLRFPPHLINWTLSI